MELMKAILFSTATAALIIIIYIARSDIDTIIMVASIYALCMYWVIKNMNGSLIIIKNEKLLLKLCIVCAYFGFNYFVIKNAVNLHGAHIIYAVLWFSVTSGLVFFKWPIKKYVNNT